MISLAELNEMTARFGLPIATVERDYVLGWILWAIGSQKNIKDQWIFKGGTCLKKCFMKNWRFSEDLDFTILPESHFDFNYLNDSVGAMLSKIQSKSGIDFSVMQPAVKLRPGEKSAEIRIYFRSITGMKHSPLSIKIDLTLSEPVITTPVSRKIEHSYSDKLPDPAEVLCYSFPELFAEKIRALMERTRPRDLYDVINLFQQKRTTVDATDLRKILAQKCENKNVKLATIKMMTESPFLDEVKAEWNNMLRHQLKELPSYEQFWNTLPDFFDWLGG